MEGGIIGSLINIGRTAASIGSRAATIARTTASTAARNAAAVKAAQASAASAAKTASNVASSVKPTSLIGRVATGAKSALTTTRDTLGKISSNPYFVAANVAYSAFDPIYTEINREKREQAQAAQDAAFAAEMEAIQKQQEKDRVENEEITKKNNANNEKVLAAANLAIAEQLQSVADLKAYRDEMEKDYDAWKAAQATASEEDIFSILNSAPPPLPPSAVAPPPAPPPSAPVIPTPAPPPYVPPQPPKPPPQTVILPPPLPVVAPPSQPPKRGKGKKVGGLVLPTVLTRLEACNPPPTTGRRRRGGCYRLPSNPRFPEPTRPQIFPDQINQFTPNPIVPVPIVRPPRPTYVIPSRPGPVAPPRKVLFRRGGAKAEAEILKMLNASR